MEVTRKRRKAVAGKEKTVGYGYVGEWNDGTLGWWLPHHVGAGGSPEPPADLFHAHAGKNDRAYLCRITVERIRHPNGRPITRKPKRST